MKSIPRLLAWLFVAAVTAGASSCDSGGIGLNVPHSGARWGGPGPDVLVGGGPP